MIDKTNITGIILAGGKSSRMGTDKGFLLWNDEPFIKHVIDALKPLVEEIIIVSSNPAYDMFGFIRIEDKIKNAGPLAGVYSGLNASKTEYNVILSCDIPLINSEVLNILIHNVNDNSEIIQVESNGKKMPLIAIYKTACKDLFFNLLRKGEKRLQFAVNQFKAKTITLDKELDFFTKNINTQQDLKAIEHACND
ncbi:molybdenum cofactor guanylyltransferase [Litoribaculum gwangyangense]|uniref:Probable molybdenum cofactor guanylyltransferase n=1 Tax=Litoribaculum gwangyangense TaxID=1130722 RepID=A0ABP9CML3_9FLAO